MGKFRREYGVPRPKTPPVCYVPDCPADRMCWDWLCGQWVCFDHDSKGPCIPVYRDRPRRYIYMKWRRGTKRRYGVI